MALFVLGDPHLSLGASKPMDIFPGWNDYVERLEKNWRKLIKPEDTIVLAGDISWAMRLIDTRRDFEFLQSLPGQKIIMKGNHDYWWSPPIISTPARFAHSFSWSPAAALKVSAPAITTFLPCSLSFPEIGRASCRERVSY